MRTILSTIALLLLAAPATAADTADKLRPVNFAFDSAALDARALNDVQWNAHVLRENPQLEIVLTGHTDAVGQLDKNRALSVDRAMAVYAALERAEVDVDRVWVMGVGEAYPRIADDDRRRSNRRVEFVVSDASDVQQAEAVQSSIQPDLLPGLL